MTSVVDLLENLEIDGLGICLAVIRTLGIGSMTGSADAHLMEHLGSADELEELLGDPMHVDGERSPAIDHHRKAQFFLRHGYPL